MRRMVSVTTLALILATAIFAQEAKQKFSAFGGGPDERACARVGYANTEKKTFGQQFAIDYGTPVWKKEYENAATFDLMTKGKVWRFGSNFWTRLDTNVPLRIAGKDVPVGTWYLGLRRSPDGAQWSLAFIDPTKVRGMTLDAFAINKAPIEFEVPLTTEKATELKDKLTVTFTPQKDDVKNVTMRISWGQLQLSAPIVAKLEG